MPGSVTPCGPARRVAPTTRGYVSSARSGIRLPILRDYDGVEIVLEPAPSAGRSPAARP